MKNKIGPKPTLDRAALVRLIEKHNGNISKIAEEAGIGRPAIYASITREKAQSAVSNERGKKSQRAVLVRFPASVFKKIERLAEEEKISVARYVSLLTAKNTK